MIVFSTGRLPSAGGWAGLVSIHRAFLVKVLLARITRGLLSIFSLGAWQKLAAGSSAVTGGHRYRVTISYKVLGMEIETHKGFTRAMTLPACFLTWEGGAASVSLFSVTRYITPS